MPNLLCVAVFATALLVTSTAAAQGLPGPALARLRTAAGEVDRGQLQTALPMLHQLALEYPVNPAVNETLGLAYIGENRPTQAIPYLRQAAVLAPRAASVLANLGITELRLNQIKSGIADLRRAVHLKPDNFINTYDLAMALARNGQYAIAARYFMRARTLAPERSDVAYNLALAQYRAHEARAAERTVATIPDAANSAAAQALWGAVAETNGEYAAAARHLKTAVHLAPTQANFIALGTEFLKHWTWNAATLTFTSGIARYPDSRRLRFGLGLTQYGEGIIDAAITTFAGLSQANPKNADFATMLGRSCLEGSRAGRPECQELIQRAAQYPENTGADIYAAAILLASSPIKGQIEAARALNLARTALKRDPKSAEAHLQAGLALSDEGKWRASIPEYRFAMRLAPHGDLAVEATYHLALAYEHTGQKARALKAMRLRTRLYALRSELLKQRLRRIQMFLVTLQK